MLTANQNSITHFSTPTNLKEALLLALRQQEAIEALEARNAELSLAIAITRPVITTPKPTKKPRRAAHSVITPVPARNRELQRFMIQTEGGIDGTWQGRLDAATQRALFNGRYFGAGRITIIGDKRLIVHERITRTPGGYETTIVARF